MPRQQLKQRADGRYCCKYKGRQFMGATQSEALAARDAYKRELAQGLRETARGVSVGAYAASWLQTYKADVTKRTYNSYAAYVDKLTDALGDRAMCDVTSTDIQALYNSMAGMSYSYIHKAVLVVNGIYKAALSDRLLLSNPCASCKPPKCEAGTHRNIEPWERELIHRVEHPMKDAVMVMLYAGLRRGEVLALDIDRDIDYNKHVLTVREAVRWDDNQPIISDPKTEAGKRSLPMQKVLEERLKGKHGLVAPSANGTHMSYTAFRKAWYSYLNAIEEAMNGDSRRWYGHHSGQGSDWLKEHPWKVFTLRPHDLRHSYCTMLYDAGVDLKTAQKWMGHADTTMIMRIYAHLTAEREKAAALALGKSVDKMVRRMQNGMQNGAGDTKVKRGNGQKTEKP